MFWVQSCFHSYASLRNNLQMRYSTTDTLEASNTNVSPLIQLPLQLTSISQQLTLFLIFHFLPLLHIQLHNRDPNILTNTSYYPGTYLRNFNFQSSLSDKFLYILFEQLVQIISVLILIYTQCPDVIFQFL
jgi:hypothetical protein